MAKYGIETSMNTVEQGNGDPAPCRYTSDKTRMGHWCAGIAKLVEEFGDDFVIGE